MHVTVRASGFSPSLSQHATRYNRRSTCHVARGGGGSAPGWTWSDHPLRRTSHVGSSSSPGTEAAAPRQCSAKVMKYECVIFVRDPSGCKQQC
ncbi:hypothetical protein MTO96_033310 [Rhipicephalus appendiculatus]